MWAAEGGTAALVFRQPPPARFYSDKGQPPAGDGMNRRPGDAPQLLCGKLQQPPWQRLRIAFILTSWSHLGSEAPSFLSGFAPSKRKGVRSPHRPILLAGFSRVLIRRSIQLRWRRKRPAAPAAPAATPPAGNWFRGPAGRSGSSSAMPSSPHTPTTPPLFAGSRHGGAGAASQSPWT